MAPQRVTWILFGATLVMVGIQRCEGVANAPTLTVSTETPHKNDRFTVSCTCDVHPQGTHMLLRNLCVGCAGGGMSWTPESLIHREAANGTLGEMLTTRATPSELLMVIFAARLTCENKMDYICACKDGGDGGYDARERWVGEEKNLTMTGC